MNSSSTEITRMTLKQFETAKEAEKIGEAIEIDSGESDRGSTTDVANSGATWLDPIKDRSLGAETPRGTTESARESGKDDTNVIGRVAAFLKRFVFLEREFIYLLIAAWIIATYLHKDFEFMGYLFAYSPEPQSGKTTLLDVLNLLASNPSGVEISPTEAMIFRTAEGHTQLFDEIDGWQDRENLRSVLNAGYKTGGLVTRLDKDVASGFKAKKFPVYGPKAFAGIGTKTLDRTTRDRTFAISMVQQKKCEKRERLRIRQIKQEVAELNRAIADWAKQHRALVVTYYNEGKFEYLDKFSDRAMDIAESLAAVVEVGFEGYPCLERVRLELIDGIRATRSEQQSATAEHRILRHLLDLTETEDPLVGNASELATMCANLLEPPNEYTVSQVLRNYGFKAQSRRKPGEEPKYRYSLSRKKLQDVVDRWAGELDAGSTQVG